MLKKRRYFYLLVAILCLAIIGFFINPRIAYEANTVPETKTATVEAQNQPSEAIVPPVVEKPKPAPKVPAQGKTSTRASKQISVEALTAYLENVPRYGHSPLAPYASQILESPHWSVIIGICTIEQYGCTRAPYNNYWGIMKQGGGLQHYATPQDGIKAISDLLMRYETRGKDTLEELNGYYVVPASASWFNTVLKTKTYLETL